MVRCLALIVLAACAGRGGGEPREPRTATPAEGIAIAIYASGERSYGVVDDRRTIEVANDTVLLDRIDPGAALQSLVIEPLGGDDSLRILSCVRERVDDTAAALAQLAEARSERPRRMIIVSEAHGAPERFRFEELPAREPAILPRPGVLSPLVRCRVRAKPGKHLVRVLHVTSTLAFQTQHDLAMTDADHVTLTTRFAIATPIWRSGATVTLYEGVPGDETPPRPLASGPIILDGSTALLASEPRTVPARLRSIYDGTKLDDSTDIKPNDIVWGRDSHHQVWVWVEVTTPRLPAGAVHAHVELPGQPIRDLELDTTRFDHTDDLARWPLWIDEDLLGTRRRTIGRADGVMITDSIQLAVSNLGDKPREVWVEERLRPAKRRVLGQAWPARPTLTSKVARTKLTLAPGTTERLGFTIDYEF